MSALHVVDLGLDFKSFASFVDEHGHPLIGNQFHFAIEDIAEKFLPTCGLLTAMLHGYAATASTDKGQMWLDQYRRLQAKLFDETKSVEAGNALSFLAQFPRPLVGPLFEMLDRQVGINGNNAPSQRRVNADSKHALCNLHINEKACHQGFHCNQLHLSCDTSRNHRHDFFSHIVEVLKARGFSREQIIHRVVDAMFFAKYGNRVTVEAQPGQYYQFFKTAYTESRLHFALKLRPEAEIALLPGAQPHKPQRLPADGTTILRELTAEATDLMEEQASPTTRRWNAVISSFVERDEPRVRAPIDPELAVHIAKGAFQQPQQQHQPFSPDVGITPLLDAVNASRFDRSS